MDYDPRDFYDEIEAQFAEELEVMNEMNHFEPDESDLVYGCDITVLKSVFSHMLISQMLLVECRHFRLRRYFVICIGSVVMSLFSGVMYSLSGF